MEQIDTVLFDLDGTLIRYRRSPGEVLDECFDRLGTGALFSVEEYYARFDEFVGASDSISELRSECFATLASENGYEAALGREVAAAFESERDQSAVEYYEGIPELLDSFNEIYQIGIVTNGFEETQRQKIEAVGLDRWVGTVVMAASETEPKPASEPFELALDRLGGSPETTVHVGDSLEADVGGAAAAGLRSVWVSPDGNPGGHAPTYRVRSTSELRTPPWKV